MAHQRNGRAGRRTGSGRLTGGNDPWSKVRRSSGIRAGSVRFSTREANMSIRPVKRLVRSKPTLEGAGVHLRRAFGFGNTSDFDPFLLLDDFRNDIPADYAAGFPWHPHR